MGKLFKIERIGDMFRLLWSWDAAGTCHHRSLTDDMKHQVALNAYELDVFSIAGLGGLSQNQKNPIHFQFLKNDVKMIFGEPVC